MKKKLDIVSLIIKALRDVFSRPLYTALAVTVGLAVLAVAIWLPNLHFITQTLHTDTLTISQKANIALSFLGALQTNFTPLSRSITIAISALFGINTALIIYYFKTRFALEKEAGVSLGGVLIGMLGVGCTSCGSVILTTVLGLSVSATLLAFLPLKGQEFGLIGVAFLIFAIITTAKKIASPVGCKAN